MKTLNTFLATGILTGALTGCQITVNITKAQTSEVLTSPTLQQRTPNTRNIYDIIESKESFSKHESHIIGMYEEYSNFLKQYTRLHEKAQKYYIQHFDKNQSYILPMLREYVAIDRAYQEAEKYLIKWLQEPDDGINNDLFFISSKEGRGITVEVHIVQNVLHILRSKKNIYRTLSQLNTNDIVNIMSDILEERIIPDINEWEARISILFNVIYSQEGIDEYRKWYNTDSEENDDENEEGEENDDDIKTASIPIGLDR